MHLIHAMVCRCLGVDGTFDNLDVQSWQSLVRLSDGGR